MLHGLELFSFPVKKTVTYFFVWGNRMSLLADQFLEAFEPQDISSDAILIHHPCSLSF